MKIAKKILLGMAAAAAVLALSSCDFLKDDTEGAIKGSLNEYSIDYTNESTDNTYRCYKDTGMKHSGGVFKIYTYPNGNDDGVMGIMWDLKTDDEHEDAREFFIVGTRYIKGTGVGVYCSKFTNVTDIQADNFGTKFTENPASETMMDPASGTKDSLGYTNKAYTLLTDEDDTKGHMLLTISIQPNDTDSDGTDGGYTVKVYSGDATDGAKKGSFVIADNAESKLLVQYNIDNTKTGYDNSYDEQNKLAFYANVKKEQTLTGTWLLGKLVHELEVEE